MTYLYTILSDTSSTSIACGRVGRYRMCKEATQSFHIFHASKNTTAAHNCALMCSRWAHNKAFEEAQRRSGMRRALRVPGVGVMIRTLRLLTSSLLQRSHSGWYGTHVGPLKQWKLSRRGCCNCNMPFLFEMGGGPSSPSCSRFFAVIAPDVPVFGFSFTTNKMSSKCKTYFFHSSGAVRSNVDKNSQSPTWSC